MISETTANGLGQTEETEYIEPKEYSRYNAMFFGCVQSPKPLNRFPSLLLRTKQNENAARQTTNCFTLQGELVSVVFFIKYHSIKLLNKNSPLFAATTILSPSVFPLSLRTPHAIRYSVGFIGFYMFRRSILLISSWLALTCYNMLQNQTPMCVDCGQLKTRNMRIGCFFSIKLYK